jgi:hypothetical protein
LRTPNNSVDIFMRSSMRSSSLSSFSSIKLRFRLRSFVC